MTWNWAQLAEYSTFDVRRGATIRLSGIASSIGRQQTWPRSQARCRWLKAEFASCPGCHEEALRSPPWLERRNAHHGQMFFSSPPSIVLMAQLPSNHNKTSSRTVQPGCQPQATLNAKSTMGSFDWDKVLKEAEKGATNLVLAVR